MTLEQEIRAATDTMRGLSAEVSRLRGSINDETVAAEVFAKLGSLQRDVMDIRSRQERIYRAVREGQS